MQEPSTGLSMFDRGLQTRSAPGPARFVGPVLLGAGGHAAVLVDALAAAGATLPCLALDPSPARHGQKVLGVPIQAGDELLNLLAEQGVRSFIVGVGSTRDTSLKRRLYELGLNHGLRPAAVVHPSATISPWACLGVGAQVLANATIGARASLGDNVLVNTGAIVEHDCLVESHTHLATGARLAGGVHIRHGAHIGINAAVMQNVTVAEGTIVGAGAVVIRDTQPGEVVVGVPAKPIGVAVHSPL